MHDPDCNRVSYFHGHPDMTYRCTQPEGHLLAADPSPCWSNPDPELMRHKHRAPVATVEDPLGLRRQGGKHRRFIGAGSGPHATDGELRRRLAASRARSAVVEA